MWRRVAAIYARTFIPTRQQVMYVYHLAPVPGIQVIWALHEHWLCPQEISSTLTLSWSQSPPVQWGGERGGESENYLVWWNNILCIQSYFNGELFTLEDLHPQLHFPRLELYMAPHFQTHPHLYCARRTQVLRKSVNYHVFCSEDSHWSFTSIVVDWLPG